MKKLGKLKWLWSLAAVLLLLGGMTACSSDDDDGSDTSGTQQPDEVSSSKITLISGSSSKGYATIQAALDACTGNGEYTIKLEKGTYAEDGLTYNGAATVKISGNTTTKYGADVIIKGKGSNQAAEKTRCTIEFQGTGNFIMENVTVQNTFTRVGYSAGTTQCEAIGFDSTGYIIGYNCAFKSHQDTMRTTGKGWFYNCYIEGDVDFIWMEVTGIVALYEKCEIALVGDETDAGYIFAPRANVASQIGKGNVILNSTITVPEKTADGKDYDAYMFRNPWGVNPSYYNQGAVVDTTITGKFNDKLAKSAAMGTADQQYVGWKVDADIATAYASKDSTIGTLSAEVKTNEYGGRRAILNRLYSVASAKFKKDVETNLKIDDIIKANNWTVDEDTSKESLDGEVDNTVVVYDMTTEEVPAGLTCTGWAKENDKAHYAAKDAGNTITFDVTGKCIVSAYGYYAGYGTIGIEGQTGEAVYDFNNKTTSSVVEKAFVNYTGAGKVTITSATTSYITKIKVEYDSTLVNVPVTAIAVSSEKEGATVGVTFNAKAAITPENATLKDVKWSSSDETKATVNELTGEVTPNAEGDVNIIATARDGSGITGQKSYTVEKAAWTVAEWYKTGDGDTLTEAGENCAAFSANTDKSLSAQTSFVNLAGETITTKHGQKLNSSGKVDIPTIASAVLTVITFEGNNTVAAPTVAGAKEDSVATAAGSSHDATNNTTTYTFYLSGADTWTINRGTSTSEINPIVYIKVVLAPVPGNTYTYDFSNVYHSAKGYSDDMLVAWDATCGNDHGIQNGTITFTVFKNTKVTLGLCQYDNPTAIVLKEGDTVLKELPTSPVATTCFSKSHPNPVADDTNSVTYTYKGEKDTAVLTISGFSYFEGIVLEPFAQEVKVTGITVSAAGDATSVPATGTLQLVATVAPADATNQKVTWASADETIATVSDAGLVTGVKAGPVKVTATATDGSEVKGDFSLTVTEAVKVTSITVKAADDATSLAAGSKLQLSATVAPENATVSTVTWSSSDETVATVTNGLVKALKEGPVKITATAADGSGTKGEYDLTITAAPQGSWMVEIGGDGTFTMGDLNVVVSGANANGHGAEVKADGTTSVKITIPAGAYILDAGTCKYGYADKPYKLTCANEDFAQEYLGTHTYATEDCYKSGAREDLFGDIYLITSATAMEITLNSDGGKEYLPFVKMIKAPTYFVEIAADGTFTNGDMTVVVSGANANGHGAEVKADGTTSVKITLPAGSYILDAGTCKYGSADKSYKLTCANEDFSAEYIGTHTYETEDCYKSGTREILFGDIFMVKSASAMEITLNSDSVKEYLPFIGVIK